MIAPLRCSRRPGPALGLCLSGAVLLPCGLLMAAPGAQAQQAGYGQTLGTTPMERQLYEGGNGRPSGGSILDATNPIDLMNRIRRGTAMDEATPPSSAIDQALRDLDAQSTATPATLGGSAWKGGSEAVTPPSGVGSIGAASPQIAPMVLPAAVP